MPPLVSGPRGSRRNYMTDKGLMCGQRADGAGVAGERLMCGLGAVGAGSAVSGGGLLLES